VASVVFALPLITASTAGTGPFLEGAVALDSALHRLATPITWISSDTSIVKIIPLDISQVAQLYLRQPGTSQITAASQGQTATLTFTVMSPVLPPPPMALTVGGFRVTNLPSRRALQTVPMFSLFTGVYLVDIFGADTTMIVGHGRLTVMPP